jgi:hypothetical protein
MPVKAIGTQIRMSTSIGKKKLPDESYNTPKSAGAGADRM